MASSKALLVSFEALPSNLFACLEPALNQQLPLTNLHWKSASRSNYRTIQQLQLSFIPFDAPVPTDHDLPSPSTSSAAALLERPFVHLCFVSCEDSDTYRSSTRHQLRAWLDKVTAGSASASSSVAKSAEWLIVLVTPASQLTKGKFYQRKSTVLDKLKSDFNSSSSKTRDRVVALPVHPPPEALQGSAAAAAAAGAVDADPAVWAELSSKLKEALIASFDQNVHSTEEDLRRIDAQRTVPGWNYCTFFERKEALAFAFESIGLLEDAVMVYDELEAGFEQSLKEHNIVFSALGGQASGDDALSLFSTSQKPYKHLIQTNNVTIFDFKCYLFARQAQVLRQMGQLREVLDRGQAFVRGLTWALRQEQGESDLLCSWIFNACMQLADLAAQAQQPATRGEFLDLARRSLERCAIARGFLPDAHPFKMCRSELPPIAPRGHQVDLQQPRLVQAFESEDNFAALYIDVLNQVKEAWQSARRGRLAVTTGHILAAFYRLRNDATKATALYASSTYGPTRWRLLEGCNLHQTLACQSSKEGGPGGREELLTALAALRAGTKEPDRGWTASPVVAENQGAYALSLLERVRARASELEKDLAAIGFPAFAFAKFTDEPCRDDTGAVVISYQVTNHLPCAVQVDEVRLKLTTQQGEQFWFLSTSTALQEGVQDLKAKSLADIKGPVVLDTFQIRISHILFQYSLRDLVDRKTSWTPDQLVGSSCHVLSIPQDPSAFSVALEQATHLTLGQNRKVLLVLQTGRHDVQEAEVSIQDTAQRAQFSWEETTSETDFEPTSEGFRLSNLDACQRVELVLSYTGTMIQPHAEMRIFVQWHNTSSPGLNRMMQTYRRLPAGLPFSVMVNNYFRAQKIISQYTVEATKAKILRIQGADLSSKDPNLRIIAARPKGAPPLLIESGRNRASFLFILEPNESFASSPEKKQLFTLSYRSVAQEREKILLDAIVGALQEHELPQFLPLARKFSSVWNQHTPVDARGRLPKEAVLRDSLEVCLSSRHLERLFGRNSASTRLAEALVDAPPRIASTCVQNMPWSSMSVEAEVPSIQVLATGSIDVDTQHRVELGHPVPATLRLAVSHCWAAEGRKHFQKHGQRMSFTLQTDPLDWAIHGQYGGEFVAKEDAEIEVDLKLVPLRAGSLQVPKITARPLPALRLPTEEEGDKEDDLLPYLPSCEVHQSNAGQRVEVISLSTESAFWVPLV